MAIKHLHADYTTTHWTVTTAFGAEKLKHHPFTPATAANATVDFLRLTVLVTEALSAWDACTRRRAAMGFRRPSAIQGTDPSTLAAKKKALADLWAACACPPSQTGSLPPIRLPSLALEA